MICQHQGKQQACLSPIIVAERMLLNPIVKRVFENPVRFYSRGVKLRFTKSDTPSHLVSLKIAQ